MEEYMAIYQDDVPLSPQEVQIAYNCGVSISADRNYRSEELTAEQVLLKQRGEEFKQVSIKIHLPFGQRFFLQKSRCHHRFGREQH